MKIARRRARKIALAVLAGCTCSQPLFAKDESGVSRSVPDADWALYGGTDGTRYSRLTEITRDNVKKLQQAWRFDMPGAGDPQTHPLAVDGVVYAYTPELKVIALDGASGNQLWQFDSGVKGQGPQRGLAWWTDGKEKRLFASVMNNLYALDPETGKPLAGFRQGRAASISRTACADGTKATTSPSPRPASSTRT